MDENIVKDLIQEIQKEKLDIRPGNYTLYKSDKPSSIHIFFKDNVWYVGTNDERGIEKNLRQYKSYSEAKQNFLYRLEGDKIAFEGYKKRNAVYPPLPF